MSKHPVLSLLACLVFGGLGILLILYPLLSNLMYENRQDGVVQSYTTAVSGLRQEQANRERLAAAKGYNRQLCSGLQQEYRIGDTSPGATLDVTGTGVIATLTIPKLGLVLPIYYGTAMETLEHGIGSLEGRSLPVGGAGTHAVLCGHSGMSGAKLFSDLPLLNDGDVFYLDVLGNCLTYQVDQIRTVLPEDMSLIAIDPAEDYCTLLTCTPFGINTHRLLVRGTRIETIVGPEAEPEQEPAGSVWMREYLSSLAVGLVLAVLLLALWFLLTRRKGVPGGAH